MSKSYDPLPFRTWASKKGIDEYNLRHMSDNQYWKLWVKYIASL